MRGEIIKMVSIIMPTYNRENVIKRSIESILTQSYQDFELIIVDDGSTDNTYQKVMEYEDSRICYLKNDRKMGANRARNIGIQHAKGDYIAFQDSDDVWRRDKLEKQMCMFQNTEYLDVIYSRYLLHLLNGEDMLVPNIKYTEDMLQKRIAYTLASANVIGTPTLIVKKKCFYEDGLFDEKLLRFQDWELCIRFAEKYQIGLVDEVLVDAYESEKSITKTVGIQLNSVSYIVRKHKIFFETHGTLKIYLNNLLDKAANEKSLEGLSESLGRELFFQAIYANVERKKKIQKNYVFLKEWILKEKNSVLINSFLACYAERSIALYGFGDIGKLFLNTLTEENREKIRYVIDQNISSSVAYKVLSLEMLTHEDLEEINCIVITAVAHEEEIRGRLEEITTVPIISVYDIINEMFSG